MSLTLLGWRRAVFELYAAVRATVDPAEAHDTWRAGRDHLFATHPDSPLLPADRARFRGLLVAPYDPAYRFVVPIDLDVTPECLEVPTASDGVVPFERFGRVHLPGIGQLDVWWLDSYGGGVFVPVRDASAGTATYGGGRYLIDTVKGADLGGDDTHLVIDFNFAYNPSCAYDPAWVCPLAPPGNIVDTALPVGELMG